MNRRSLKKIVSIAVAGALSIGMIGCSTASEAPDEAGEIYTLRVSFTGVALAKTFQKLEQLEERLLEKSNGQIVLELYSDSQLGTTNETVQAVQNGDAQIAFTDSATLAGFATGDGKNLDVLSGPFLFDGIQSGLKFYEGDVFGELADALESETKLKVVALNWLQGQRSMIGSTAYVEPSDMAGKRVRVPPIETWTRTFDLIGAVPTTVEIAESFSALDQGVVDATENGIQAIIAFKYFEAVQELTLTKHFMPFYGFVMNQDVLAGMPEELQELLLSEFNAAGNEFSLETEEEIAGAIKDLESKGVTVHEANLDAYQKITAPFYDAYPTGFVDRIRASAK